jgi:hypothetical protein
MSIQETINSLEDVKQRDLNQTATIAQAGVVHAGELDGLVNNFDKLLNDLPFAQLYGKLQDVVGTANAGKAQCHETGDNLVRIIGDIGNEDAMSATQSTYNMGHLMDVSYWEDNGVMGVQLAVEHVKEDLAALQEMAVTMQERLERVKESVGHIGDDFKMICGSTGPERLLKRLVRLPVLEKGDTLIGQTKEDITAYQQYLSS